MQTISYPIFLVNTIFFVQTITPFVCFFCANKLHRLFFVQTNYPICLWTQISFLFVFVQTISAFVFFFVNNTMPLPSLLAKPPAQEGITGEEYLYPFDGGVQLVPLSLLTNILYTACVRIIISILL